MRLARGRTIGYRSAMTPPRHNPASTLLPLLMCALAILGGACVDALVKAVGPQTGLLSLLAWRFLFGAALCGAIFALQRRTFPGPEALRFHALRSVVHISAAWTFFYAILQLGLAEAPTFGFTAALMVAPMAWAVLGERMKRVAIIATLVGFVGVVIALTGAPPDPVAGQNRLMGLISIFASAGLYAMTLILIRMRSRTEDALTIVFMTNLMPLAILWPPLILLEGVMPPPEWPWLALLGVLGVAVWWLMTMAYARAPAQQLAPLEYTALIWSALFGYVYFAEIPPWQTYAGAAIIIAACLTVAVDTHFASRRAARAPASAPGDP